MALSHSPKIITEGLAFYYDMSNSQKSWKGPPVVNLVTDAATMAGWNNYSNGPAAPYVTDLGTTGWYMNNAGSWNGCYKTISGITPGTYTFSCWAKYLGGHPNQTGGAVYISGWGGGDVATYINKNITGWQRISRTINVTTTSLTFYLISWGGTNNSDNSSWQVTMPQMELGAFATPFVNGARSNTQAILDLTNNNTITANSLTYAADGTFSFNGSSDYLTIPNTTLGNGNISWSVSCWIKTTTTTNSLGGGSILSNISGGPVYSMMGVNNGKIVYWTYQNSAWAQKLGIRTVNDGNWHMLTWVNYSNSTMDMYVDGILDVSVANSTSGNNNPVDVIGRSWSGYFPGYIASLTRYTKSLTAAEVQQNFQALRGRYGI